MIRRNPRARWTVALVCSATLLAALEPAGAGAQERSVEISVAGGWLNPTGGDFAGTEAGLGGDVALRFPLGERATLGGGLHWSRHGVDFTEDAYDIVAIFAEPRVLLGRDGPVRPFVAARLAWAREAITVGAEDRSANGVGVGASAGVVVPLTDSVGLELGAGVYHLSFGDFSAGGRALGIDGGSGRALALRLALSARR